MGRGRWGSTGQFGSILDISRGADVFGVEVVILGVSGDIYHRTVASWLAHAPLVAVAEIQITVGPGMVHAWVGQIVTFCRYGLPACP